MMRLEPADQRDSLRSISKSLSLMPGFGDLATAELTAPVSPGDDPLEGVLDLAQFAALDLDDLRADLVVGRIDGGVDAIADDVERGEFAVSIQVARERLAEGITASDQPGMKTKQRIFASHYTPPGVRRGHGQTLTGVRVRTAAR